MTIHWDDAAIPWRDIDFTTNDVILLSPHNALFNSETKQKKRILDAKYENPILNPSQKAPLILILRK